MMRYPHIVSFQTSVETTLPSGQRAAGSWEDVVGLTDLPARVIPVVASRAAGMTDEPAERMVVESDGYTVVVQGDREVDVGMRAVTDYLDDPLQVRGVQRPTIYASRMTEATIVSVERISAAGGS